MATTDTPILTDNVKDLIDNLRKAFPDTELASVYALMRLMTVVKPEDLGDPAKLQSNLTNICNSLSAITMKLQAIKIVLTS